MSENLQTITLIDENDQPTYSLCPGHVDARTFQAAFQEEGWSGECSDDELTHEWWVQNEDGGYERADLNTPGAKPYTVTEW